MNGRNPDLAHALDAITHYNDLLGKMELLTDKLTADVRSADLRNVNSMLESRALLCREIAASSRRVEQSLGKLRSRESTHNDNGFQHDSLRVSLDHTHRLQNTILEKQAQCESALVASLATCQEALSALGKRKHLKTAYQSTAHPAPARFLDNRQ